MIGSLRIDSLCILLLIGCVFGLEVCEFRVFNHVIIVFNDLERGYYYDIINVINKN